MSFVWKLLYSLSLASLETSIILCNSALATSWQRSTIYNHSVSNTVFQFPWAREGSILSPLLSPERSNKSARSVPSLLFQKHGVLCEYRKFQKRNRNSSCLKHWTKAQSSRCAGEGKAHHRRGHEVSRSGTTGAPQPLASSFPSLSGSRAPRARVPEPHRSVRNNTLCFERQVGHVTSHFYREDATCFDMNW